ncbi:MAG: phytanoyl-CoA dioxygenase family protein [Candidatus Latescibacterota bacterium]|nr:phytanoyl-CoA dioxygenase family protein [Candidatus Latescibacterota bacterium]
MASPPSPLPIDRFHEQGFHVERDVIDEDELQLFGREIRRLHKVALTLDGSAQSGDFQREPYADGANDDAGLPILRKIENTRRHSPAFAELSRHPIIVQRVHELLGEDDLLLFRSTLMLKPAFHGSVHGLHQDSAYWPMDPPQLVTVSIALTDAAADNGCFQVIPASHTWGLQEWKGLAREQDAALTDRRDIDPQSATTVPLRAGSALFFHSLLVHGSGPNQSSRPRHTALYAYFSPQVRYLPPEGAPRERSFPVISGMEGAPTAVLTAAD